MKNKVEKALLKSGNNPTDVKKMIAEHFDYAESQFTTVKKIAECIRTLY